MNELGKDTWELHLVKTLSKKLLLILQAGDNQETRAKQCFLYHFSIA
jgi:hypothetical protein